MAAKVKLRSAGVREILTSSATRSLLTDKAEATLARAKSSAPVASGEYRDSLQIVQDTTDRAVARVVATAAHGMVVEADTGNLARALG